jgi:tetratricopeptide (TPR) repeat protein
MTVFDPSAWGPRPAIWRDSLGLIASRPILGYGPDNFGLVYPRFQATNIGRSQVDKAHSESLQVTATQGLVGLAAYLLVLAAFVRAFWQGRHSNGALAIFAGWLAYQVTLQLNFSALASSLPFWIFAAAAMEGWGATRATVARTIGRRRLATALAGVAVAALAALAVVGTVFPYRADRRLLAAVQADVAGRWEAAMVASAEARALLPSESVYAVEAGNIAFEHGDWIAASAAYEDAARLGTFNPLVYRNLALAERNLGRVPQARAAARKALELDRFDPANQALLAEFETPKT